MAYSYGQTPASITTGNINLSLPPPTAVNGSLTTLELVSGSHAIPAGAKWVSIYNAGLIETGDDPNQPVTVNGVTWSVGRREVFTTQQNEAAAQQVNLPAITVVSSGSRVLISYII